MNYFLFHTESEHHFDRKFLNDIFIFCTKSLHHLDRKMYAQIQLFKELSLSPNQKLTPTISLKENVYIDLIA